MRKLSANRKVAKKIVLVYGSVFFFMVEKNLSGFVTIATLRLLSVKLFVSFINALKYIEIIDTWALK